MSMVAQTLGLVAPTAAVEEPKKVGENEGEKANVKAKKAEWKLDKEQIDSMLALELTNSNPLNYKLEFPLASFVEKISKIKKLKTQFEASIKDFDAGQMTTPKQWTWAYLVAKSFGNQAKAGECVEQVEKWLLDAHEFKAEGTSIPDELALTAMAKLLETEGSNNDLAIRILERAESIAKDIQQPELARSLRCEVAVRISKTDPAKCRSILSSTLDELFPPIAVKD